LTRALTAAKYCECEFLFLLFINENKTIKDIRSPLGAPSEAGAQ